MAGERYIQTLELTARWSSILVAAFCVSVAAGAAEDARLVTEEGWFAPPERIAPAASLDEKPARVFVIPVRRPIARRTYQSIRSRLEQARRRKAQLIVLDMDCTGGDMATAMKIARMLKVDVTDIRTVSYLRTNAIGAGAVIAMACDEIVMSQVGKFGGGRIGAPRASEASRKEAESVLLTELAESARLNGYSVPLAEKMVSESREVWLIRNKRTRQLRYVRAGDWRGRVEIQPGLAPAPSNKKAPWMLLRVVVRKGDLLTMLPHQAKQYGFARAVVAAPRGEPLSGLMTHYNVSGEPIILDSDRPLPSKTATTGPAAAKAAPKTTHEGHFVPVSGDSSQAPLPEKVTKAFVIPIREPILKKTFGALKRKVIQCRAAGAELIVFDMDTWGGDAMAALDIARLIKTELSDIYTVCYVNTRGISAGALIALACNEIVMTPVGKLGDCAPILMQGKLEGTKREKIETTLREEFAESARLNGYNAALAVSMVSIDHEVWLVRHVETGELKYVLAKKYLGKVAFPKGMIEGESPQDADWDLIEVAVRKGELLTMESRKAQRLGFVSALIKATAPRGLDAPPVRALDGVMKHFGVVGPPVVLTDMWSEELVGWLTSPTMAGLLMLLGILGIYTEMRTPGVGLPGAVGVICFAILFGSHYLMGLAAWWEIVVFLIGVVLIALEVFVIPGFGVAGVSGGLCCAIGVLAMFVDNPVGSLPIPSGELSLTLFTNSVMALAFASIGAIVLGAIIARYLPGIPILRRLVLADAQSPPAPPVAEESPTRLVQVGDSGTVESVLRPVGKVRFGEALLDAVADGGRIDVGAKVRVLRHDGNRLIVEQMENV